MGEFEQIPAIRELAKGTIGEELMFSHSNAVTVIEICTRSRIAVLGVEMFEPKGIGLQALGCSDYTVTGREWAEFVRSNNEFATETILRNPAEDNEVFVLTTCSEAEFGEISKSV